MNSKRAGTLLGIGFIIFGLFALLKLSIFGYLVPFALGSALLLLYYAKRKNWALELGVVFFGYATYKLCLQIPFISLKAGYVMFFFIPGAIFLALFLTKKRQECLIPGSFLLWTGLALTLNASFQGIAGRGSFLTIGLGLASITVYLLGYFESAKTFLLIGIIITAIGIFGCFRAIPAGSLSTIGWIVVAILLFTAIKVRRKQ